MDGLDGNDRLQGRIVRLFASDDEEWCLEEQQKSNDVAEFGLSGRLIHG